MVRLCATFKRAPGEWLRLLARKWFLTWHAIEFVDAEAIHTHARHSPVLATLSHVLHFGVLSPLAVLGAWLTRRQWRQLWCCTQLRWRWRPRWRYFTSLPATVIPWCRWRCCFPRRDWLRVWSACTGSAGLIELAVGLVLASAAAIVANWPMPQRFNDDAVTYYNTGSTLMAVGRAQEAIAMLREAEEADPSFPDTYNNLGRALLDQGRSWPRVSILQRRLPPTRVRRSFM